MMHLEDLCMDELELEDLCIDDELELEDLCIDELTPEDRDDEDRKVECLNAECLSGEAPLGLLDSTGLSATLFMYLEPEGCKEHLCRAIIVHLLVIFTAPRHLQQPKERRTCHHSTSVI